MGILSAFLSNRGKPSAPASVEELSQRLADLAAARKRLQAANAERRERRRGLLIIDETDEEISELERASSAAELEIERLDEAEPLLLAELAVARGRQRAKAWAEIRARFYPAGADYLSKMRAARDAFDKLASIRADAHNSGFIAEAGAAFAPAPMILDRDLLNSFERAILHSESVAAPAVPSPKVVPPSPATVVVEVVVPLLQLTGGPPARMGDRRRLPLSTAWELAHQGSVRWVDGKAPPDPSAPKPWPAPPAAAPAFAPPKADADGMVELTVLRAGLPIAGGPARVGEVRRVPIADALELLKAGGVEVADAKPEENAA
jgi:hypothetical protein